MKNKYLLFLILILATFLRFWNLGSYPALNADEASNSYDAYSLSQTGMDQHGHVWPLTFQSFNDYKPGLYVYLDLPFVKLLGLNAWSARIPGAIFGVLSVLMLYLLVKELFNDEKLGLIASLFLAISPWHIHFSRGGWEVNTATSFLLIGLVFFFYGMRPVVNKMKIINLVLASFFLVASLYTYHAVRVIIPLLGLSILLIYKTDIFKNFKPYLTFGIITLALLTPLALDLLSPGALSRVAGVGLFADPGPTNRINEQRGEHANLNSVASKILHNKIVNYGLAFGNNYLTHFNGEFLFMSGDAIQRNKVPETGEMYLFDMLFLVFGFIFLTRNFDNNRKFIISWLLISPVASALTFQSPNALRSQNMAIPLIVVSSYGFYHILKQLNKVKSKYIAFLGYFVLIILIIWNFCRYLNMYYMHMSKVYPYSSQYGVPELASFINENGAKYSNIYITQRYDQPYVLMLFYLRYPPQKFQNNHNLTARDLYGFSTVSNFDKYHFGPVDLELIQKQYLNNSIHGKSLIIGTPEEITGSANIIKKIYGTNGFEYFDVVEY